MAFNKDQRRLRTEEAVEGLTTGRERVFTEDDVRHALLRAIELAGSQQAFAAATGFSKQYVSNVVRQHRRGTISDALAQKLGFERQVVYVHQLKDSRT